MSQPICSFIRVPLIVLILSGCDQPPGQDQAEPNSSPPSAAVRPPSPAAPAGLPSEDTSGWRAETVQGGGRDPGIGTGSGILSAVRIAAHPGFDRAVFEFSGRSVPGYHVEYVDRPVTACGSGATVPLPGDAWLEIRFEPAAAHDQAGQPTVVERKLRPNLPNLIALELTCDFEAAVTWVAAVRTPGRIRVRELSGPARLVVDVRN